MLGNQSSYTWKVLCQVLQIGTLAFIHNEKSHALDVCNYDQQYGPRANGDVLHLPRCVCFSALCGCRVARQTWTSLRGMLGTFSGLTIHEYLHEWERISQAITQGGLDRQKRNAIYKVTDSEKVR